MQTEAWPQKPRPPYDWLFPPGGYPILEKILHQGCCASYQQISDYCLQQVIGIVATKKATTKSVKAFCAANHMFEDSRSPSPAPNN
ncbi:MAG: hypothetical protein JO131_08125 [Gammaproteobacteria bacterium]|nr:hypothetical protein [Gammaproteobacteria bacterium]